MQRGCTRTMDSISSHFFEIEISQLLLQSEPGLALVERPTPSRATNEADSICETASRDRGRYCHPVRELEDHPLPAQCRNWLDSIIVDVRSSLHESTTTISNDILWPANETTSILAPIPESIAYEDACWRSVLASRARRGIEPQDAVVHRSTTFAQFLKYLLRLDNGAICWKDQNGKAFKVGCFYRVTLVGPHRKIQIVCKDRLAVLAYVAKSTLNRYLCQCILYGLLAQPYPNVHNEYLFLN
jgi:hypothetical protein